MAVDMDTSMDVTVKNEAFGAVEGQFGQTVLTFVEREQLRSTLRDYKIREIKLLHQITVHQTSEIVLREEKRKLYVENLILQQRSCDLEETVERQSEQLNMAARRSKRLVKEKTELLTSSKDHVGSVTTLEKQLRERNTTIKKMEKKIEDVERQAILQKDEMEKYKQEAAESKEATKAAKLEVKSAKDQLSVKAKKEKSDSAAKISELEKTLKTMTADVKALNRKNETLTAELEISKKENEKVVAMQKEKTTVTSKVTEVEKLLKKANADIKKLTKQAEALTTDAETSRREAEKALADLREQGESSFKVSELEKALKKATADVKKLTKQVDTLTTEMEARDNDAEKSSSVLKEKLALQRQVTSLEAENESLKISSENHKEILSEKLQLAHRLESLQVELENEKKASKRAVQSKTDTTDLKKKHEKELKELKEQLVKQTKTAERTVREREKEQADNEANKAVLEKKIENLKNKLKTEKATAGPSKKRTATAFDVSEDSPAPKRAKKSTTLKSTFSTTPFLKRAVSVVPLSPEASSSPSRQLEETIVEEPATAVVEDAEPTVDANETALSVDLMPPPPPPATLKVSKPKAKPKARRESSVAPVKMLLTKTALAHTKRAPSITPVSTRPSLLDDDTPPKATKKASRTQSTAIDKENDAPSDEEDEPIKIKQKPKMRKLMNNTLGNTLFDDDGEDGHFNKIRAPSVMGFSKDFSPLKKRSAGFEGIRKQFVLGKAAK